MKLFWQQWLLVEVALLFTIFLLVMLISLYDAISWDISDVINFKRFYEF